MRFANEIIQRLARFSYSGLLSSGGSDGGNSCGGLREPNRQRIAEFLRIDRNIVGNIETHFEFAE